MPNLAKKFCGVPGCTEYAVKGTGRCALHGSAAARRVQRESDAWYRTKRWQAMRDYQLAKEPLCRECLAVGKLTPATECDHIIPHKGNELLFFDRKNLQSLCKKCHSRKTAAEDGGFGHKSFRSDL